MLKKNEKVLVCVSGGPDSVCLLLILNGLESKLKPDIHIAHLNHMLRGKESDDEEEFVRKLAKSLKLPAVIGRKDVSLFAKKEKLSLEDAARRARLEFFLKAAGKIKACKIALGHTLDDQAETVMMRILRGAGLKGLSGIWPAREINNSIIIRPLLKVTKKEVLRYLKVKNVEARLDSSNTKNIYLRNKIRLNLIPYLKRNYNPKIKETLAVEAEVLRRNYQYIEKKAERVFEKTAGIKDGQVIIDLKKLFKEDNSLVSEVLRRSIYHVKGNLNRISYRHILDLEKLIRDNRGTSFLDLPAGLKAIKEYYTLKIYRGNSRAKKHIKSSYLLSILKVNRVNKLGFEIKAELLGRQSYIFAENKMIEFVDFDKLKGKLTLRFKKVYDKFKPLGMKQEKSLKNFFIDSKIAKCKRENIPLVICNNKIVWVVGHRISEDFKVTEETGKILKLTAKKL